MREEDLRAPRLSVELSYDEQIALMQAFAKLPHGMKSAYFRAIVRDTIPMVNKFGMAFVGAVISGRIELMDMYMKKPKARKKGATRKTKDTLPSDELGSKA